MTATYLQSAVTLIYDFYEASSATTITAAHSREFPLMIFFVMNTLSLVTKHCMQHGAVVMLYHPCADRRQIAKLRRVVTSCLRRHVITPSRQLSRAQVSLTMRRLQLRSTAIRLLINGH